MNDVTLLARIQPKRNCLIVSKGEVGARERKTAGGIIVPSTADQRRREHGLFTRVLKVGPGCSSVPGDVVLIAEFSGVPIRFLQEERPLWLINQGEVLATVVPEAGDDFALECDLARA